MPVHHLMRSQMDWLVKTMKMPLNSEETDVREINDRHTGLLILND